MAAVAPDPVAHWADRNLLAPGASPLRRALYYGLIPSLAVGYAFAMVAANDALGTIMPAFLVFRLLTIVFELVQPRRRDFLPPFRQQPWRAVKQVVKDIVYIRLTLFAATVPDRLGGGVATWIEERRAHLLPFLPWPTSAPLFVRTLLAIFVIENGAYWAHRLSHNTALLWQFHATHHAVREMYSLRGARNHPLDIIWISLPALPLAAFFGIGEEELTYGFGFTLFVNILAHANILGVSPILGWFVTAPEHHWVHHSQDVAESRSNFACGLILLDRLYGTFRPHTQKLCLGLEGRPGDSLKAELLEPFYKKLAGEYREGAPPAAPAGGG